MHLLKKTVIFPFAILTLQILINPTRLNIYPLAKNILVTTKSLVTNPKIPTPNATIKS